MADSKVTEFGKRKTEFNGKKILAHEGFPYVSLKNDVNGFKFREEHLKKYARQNKYTITVARKNKDEIVLDNYIIENEELVKFFKAFVEGKIEGEIIEIDKFNPEILA